MRRPHSRESRLARAGVRGRHLETLPVAGHRSRDCRRRAGGRWRELQAAGADRYAGAGIYYACTTVEADLYDGADVAVVGGGNSAGQAAVFLAECCPTRTVHLLIRRTLGPGMSQYLSQRIQATANVVVHEQTEIEAIHGHRHIEATE